MITDLELQRNVQDAINGEMSLSGAEIGVSIHEGIVTLTGSVDCWIKKSKVEHAVQHVAGVTAVVEKIEVRLGGFVSKNDNKIAEEVLDALEATYSVPQALVKVKVEAGWITLDGVLPWNYQKIAATGCTSYLPGVKGVINKISPKDF